MGIFKNLSVAVVFFFLAVSIIYLYLLRKLAKTAVTGRVCDFLSQFPDKVCACDKSRQLPTFSLVFLNFI